MKGYSLNGNNKDKLMNEYNNLYGFNLKDKEEDMFKSYIKPKYSDGFKKLNKYENPLSYKLLLYSIDGNFIKQFESILEASKELNIPVGNISKHLKGDTKICYNYIFKKFTKDFSLNINKIQVGN